jgi:hypothetical protein
MTRRVNPRSSASTRQSPAQMVRTGVPGDVIELIVIEASGRVVPRPGTHWAAEGDVRRATLTVVPARVGAFSVGLRHQAINGLKPLLEEFDCRRHGRPAIANT